MFFCVGKQEENTRLLWSCAGNADTINGRRGKGEGRRGDEREENRRKKEGEKMQCLAFPPRTKRAPHHQKRKKNNTHSSATLPHRQKRRENFFSPTHTTNNTRAGPHTGERYKHKNNTHPSATTQELRLRFENIFFRTAAFLREKLDPLNELFEQVRSVLACVLVV